MAALKFTFKKYETLWLIFKCKGKFSFQMLQKTISKAILFLQKSTTKIKSLPNITEIYHEDYFCWNCSRNLSQRVFSCQMLEKSTTSIIIIIMQMFQKFITMDFFLPNITEINHEYSSFLSKVVEIYQGHSFSCKCCRNLPKRIFSYQMLEKSTTWIISLENVLEIYHKESFLTKC